MTTTEKKRITLPFTDIELSRFDDEDRTYASGTLHVTEHNPALTYYATDVVFRAGTPNGKRRHSKPALVRDAAWCSFEKLYPEVRRKLSEA